MLNGAAGRDSGSSKRTPSPAWCFRPCAGPWRHGRGQGFILRVEEGAVAVVAAVMGVGLWARPYSSTVARWWPRIHGRPLVTDNATQVAVSRRRTCHTTSTILVAPAVVSRKRCCFISTAEPGKSFSTHQHGGPGAPGDYLAPLVAAARAVRVSPFEAPSSAQPRSGGARPRTRPAERPPMDLARVCTGRCCGACAGPRSPCRSGWASKGSSGVPRPWPRCWRNSTVPWRTRRRS